MKPVYGGLVTYIRAAASYLSDYRYQVGLGFYREGLQAPLLPVSLLVTVTESMLGNIFPATQ